MKELYADSIIKSWDIKQILTDVYISCQQGEILGLLGRNGSGKSTLLEILFGSLSADNKFIKIDQKISKGLFHNRKTIKYLPQEHFLPNHIKINSLIKLFCNKKKAEVIQSHPLIKQHLHKKCTALSGGERRLLEVLLITHSESNYNLIDEPFNGVEPIYKEEIKSIIQQQSKTKGFIITDHDYKNVLDIASRVVILHDGGIKPIHHPKELIKWGYISENTIL